MSLADHDRRALAAAAGPGLGDDLAAGGAELLPRPVRGLQGDAVWLVRSTDVDHPRQVYVGRWPDGSARLLSGDQGAFFDLAAASGVDLTGAADDEVVRYVADFLEVTRHPAVRAQVVTGPDAITWRPGSPEEEARRAAFEASTPIEAPQVQPSPDGFRVSLLLVVDQRIQRNTFEVGSDGSISASYDVLADHLPLPIAR